MRRPPALLLAIGLLVPAAACSAVIGVRGSGDITRVTRDVPSFTRVALENQGRVRIEVTGTQSLAIETDDNLLDRLTSEVTADGTLELATTEQVSPTDDIIYTITVVALDGVSIGGSGDITVLGIVGERFDIDIGGSGSVDAPDLAVEQTTVGIGGSGSVTLTGATRMLDIDVGGSGDVDATGLIAESATVSVGGSGSAQVNVAERLEARVSGSGDITYLGDPTVDADVSGSGSIDRG